MRQPFLPVVFALIVAVGLPASTAEACISCEYVPPVVNSGSKASSGTKSHQARSPSKPRSIDAARERRTKVTRERSRERDTVTKTAAPAAAPSQKTSPVTTAKNEHSTITRVAAPAVSPPAPESTAALPSAGDGEHSSIAGSADVRTQRAEADPAHSDSGPPTNVGCKKFFPSVGLTLSVPCE